MTFSTGTGNRCAAVRSVLPVPLLAAFALTAAACAAPSRLEVRGDGWTDDPELPSILWTSGDVDVGVVRQPARGTFPVLGWVRCRAPGALRVAFAPGAAQPDGAEIGVESHAGEPRIPIVAGGEIEVPEAEDGEPRELHFAVRADASWPSHGDVAAYAPATWEIVVSSGWGACRCALRAEVAETSVAAGDAARIGGALLLIGAMAAGMRGGISGLGSDFGGLGKGISGAPAVRF